MILLRPAERELLSLNISSRSPWSGSHWPGLNYMAIPGSTLVARRIKYSDCAILGHVPSTLMEEGGSLTENWDIVARKKEIVIPGRGKQQLSFMCIILSLCKFLVILQSQVKVTVTEPNNYS